MQNPLFQILVCDYDYCEWFKKSLDIKSHDSS